MATPSPKDNLRRKKARLYADAFLAVMRDSGDFDAFAVAAEELSELLSGSPDLKRLLQSRHHDPALKAKVMKEIGQKAGLGGVEGLVDALAGNGDLALLPDVLGQVLKTTREEIVIAHVTTARPLDAQQEKSLAQSLREKFNKRVRLKVAEDPELLGGLKVRVGDTVIDGSLRGRLDRLREDLRKPPGR